MASYELNKWTQSTLATLRHIHEQNQKGIKTEAKDLASGTWRNWAYALIKGGYLKNENGFHLSNTGNELLTKLSLNPPENRRGKTRRQKGAIPKSRQSQQALSDDVYRVLVQGKDLGFEMILTEEQAIQVVNLVSDLKRNKLGSRNE